MFIKKPFSLISVEYSAGCWDMHDAMSAINVEMRKVVLPITCKYEKDVDKDSDLTKCIWAFSMKKTRKLLKGLYRWKLGMFF